MQLIFRMSWYCLVLYMKSVTIADREEESKTRTKEMGENVRTEKNEI